MSFYTEFARTLLWRPSQALVALYWHLTRRRVRARNWLRRDVYKAPYAYALWIKAIERAPEAARSASKQIDHWSNAPLISVILPWGLDGTDDRLAEAIRSIEQQCYPHWEMILPLGDEDPLPSNLDRPDIHPVRVPHENAAAAINHAIAASQGAFLLPMRPGAILPPTALFHYAEAHRRWMDADILFGDQDRIDHNGERSEPWFKPQWNAEMILGQDYVSSAYAIRTTTARQVNPVESDLAAVASYALVLRASALPETKIVHIPHMLAHVVPNVGEDGSQGARVLAVTRHVASAKAKATAGAHGLVRVEWPLPNPLPLVSVIIPTRDRVDLLRTCIDSLRALTNWPRYEIIVVDNDSADRESLTYFDKLRLLPDARVLPYPQPYNYSAINNFAASHAKGSYLCLLNNDTEIVSAGWLEAMMRHAVRSEVGAVGAKLLYEDDSVQHAGVIIGMGNAAGHAHRFQKPGDQGYFHQVDLARFVSAVTAACLVVDKNKFDAVGGLDSENLQIAYNDVDFCLKLQQAGWSNVYEPEATLRHYESKSRGNDLSPQHLKRYLTELAVLQKRWGTETIVDPSHHPLLDRSQETYVFRF
jgi:GT2 family glycosyltransferase